MNSLQLKKFQKNFHQWTPHIVSFDFRKTPSEIKNEIEDFYIVSSIPLLRLIDTRQLLINEADESWIGVKNILASLDGLPEVVLRDLYDTYLSKCGKDVNVKNIESSDARQTERNIVFVLLPELLWCFGDDKIRTRIFNQ